MTIVAVWLHVLGVVVWMGGLVYQAHALAPAARRDGAASFATAAARGRPAAWTALGLTVLTGLYNVTRLGPLERVMESGAALALAGKLVLVLVIVLVAGQRDFAQVPRLHRALTAGEDPGPALTAIGWLDRIAILLGVIVVYLGLAISRS
ncbi:MAG TPA: CopD family protein [Methylomirabilota bacterium]|nr:CopD family protein [Methylomirabilota bacterium]